MGIFRQFPYSNFHDMNMDELIKIVRQLADDWLEYQTKWANLYDDVSTAFEAFQRDFNDFLNGAQTEFTAFMTAKNSEFTAFMNNIDVAVELRAALNTMVADGTFNTIVRAELTPAIEAWLNSHITEPTGVVIDTSLSVAGACADAKATGDADADIITQIKHNNSFDVIQKKYNRNDAISSGISYTWTGNRCTVYGTASAQNFNNIFAATNAIPSDMIRGKWYYVDFEATAVELEILQMNSSGGIVASLFRGYSGGPFFVPANISGMVIRLLVRNGAVVNEIVEPRIRNEYGNDTLTKLMNDEVIRYKGDLAINTDLNTISTGVWQLASNRNYSNSPIPNQRYGSIICYKEGNVTLQVAYDGALFQTFVRMWIGTNYTNWHETSDPYKEPLIAGTNLNTVDKGVWLMASGRHYENTPLPESQYGTLIVYKETNVTFQIIYGGGSSAGKSWVRSWIDNNYSSWQSATGGGTQIFNEYNNTYNVTAYPQIRTDTNSYLAPTGDTTDVTNSIVTMLTQTGVCRLGKGDYYIKELVMPENTSIVGCGKESRLILISGSSTFAVAPKTNCIIRDLSIVGNLNDVTPSSSVGNRHAILWQGTYTQDATAPAGSIIENVFIYNFAGGAITCYDTGYGVVNSIEAANVFIWNCDAGINVVYWSEYHKFTNIRANNCYYGCINNGGNNTFVNCDFSGNTIGFLMDNGLQQSPNNSHGTCVGCVFNHSGNNTGIGIKILNCDNGYIFTGCQIFFSQIYIEDSDGIVISDSNFGVTNCDITIKNGSTTIFSTNLHQGSPTITITNNNKVHFINCYDRTTGELITA